MSMLSSEQRLTRLLDTPDHHFTEAEKELLAWWHDAQQASDDWYPSMADDIAICRMYDRVVLGVVHCASAP